jgi:hypothetical protein
MKCGGRKCIDAKQRQQEASDIATAATENKGCRRQDTLIGIQHATLGSDAGCTNRSSSVQPACGKNFGNRATEQRNHDTSAKHGSEQKGRRAMRDKQVRRPGKGERAPDL